MIKKAAPSTKTSITFVYIVTQTRQKTKAVLDVAKTKPWFRLLLLWLAAYAVLLSFLFTTILEKYNYLEIFPSRLTIPLAMHAFTALLISLFVYKVGVLKTHVSKLTAVIVLALSLQDYQSNLQLVAGPIRAFVPGLTGNDSISVVSAIYIVCLAAIAVGVGVIVRRVQAHFDKIRDQDAQFGIVVLLGFLLLTPTFSLMEIMPAMIRQSHVELAEFPTPTGASSVDKPDVYYIVLDRYTNAEVLQNQFGYDNTPFTGFLRDNGFRVNDSARSNYPYTAISIASTMNATYLDTLLNPYKNSELQSNTLLHNTVWQSTVAKAFKKAGYSYEALGSWYGTSQKAPLANKDRIIQNSLKIFGKSKQLRGVEAGEFSKTPYYSLTQLSGISWWPLSYSANDHPDIVRQQLNNLEAITTAEKPGGRFIFAHILVPHDPFIFNADGSLSADSAGDSVGKPIKQKYVDQVAFINGQMQEAINNINEQSHSKAVIIINADEGAYPWVMNSDFRHPAASSLSFEEGQEDEDMRTWPDDWLQMKYGILQAARIPEATDDDMTHLSSVNAFRIVLNRYLGYNLEYLPECQFGVIKGSQRIFNFADMTRKLDGQTSDYCQNHQSLPDQN